MSDRYLKQVLVTRRDLNMGHGKLAAMAGHGAMSFIANRLKEARPVTLDGIPTGGRRLMTFEVSDEEAQWLTELDPGLEDLGQISFAKVVLFVDNEEELLQVLWAAGEADLVVETVHDSGHSHNPARTLAVIAIGPDWPERIDPVTEGLKTR